MAQPRHDTPATLLPSPREVKSAKCALRGHQNLFRRTADSSRKSNFLSQQFLRNPVWDGFLFRHICQPLLPLPMHFYVFIISRISRELYSLRTFFNTKKSFIAICYRNKKKNERNIYCAVLVAVSIYAHKDFPFTKMKWATRKKRELRENFFNYEIIIHARRFSGVDWRWCE